jgi:hypothetical protein
MLKIYTLPNHTITIGVCILETQLSSLLYGCGASFVQKWSVPWMSANICIGPFSINSLISMVSSENGVGAREILSLVWLPYRANILYRDLTYITADIQSNRPFGAIVALQPK